MDFNTGPDRSSERVSGGVPGGEFNTSDPVGSFISTAQSVLFRPVGFFRSIPRQGNLLNPVVFAVICAAIAALLSGLIGILLAIAGVGEQGVGGAIGSFFLVLILTPILTPIGLFIGTAISHLFVLIFVRPVNAGFWATFRVVSYVSATSLIGWFPIIGGLVAGIWGIVLSIFGIREIHNTTTGRAALVVLIPVAIVLLLIGLVAFSILVAIFFGTQQGQF